MSTFNQDNYLPITFYLNGEWERDEPFDYDQYVKDIAKEREDYLLLLGSLDEEEREEAKQAIESLDKLKDILKAIWEGDGDEYIENYEEQ
jgi:hypothetical protein